MLEWRQKERVNKLKIHQKRGLYFSAVSTLILVLTIAMVKYMQDRPKMIAVKSTELNLTKIKKIKKKKNVSKMKKKRKKIKQKMKELKPSLSVATSGMNFGLDMGQLGAFNMDEDLVDGDDNIVMDENLVDKKPKILKRSALEFPEIALANNIEEGRVEIRILIDNEGRVAQSQLLEATPKGIFEDAALSSVQDWVFEPAQYRGKAVAIWAKQVVKFGE